MNVKEWFNNLSPKRKFALKAIAKVTAVSIPYADQIHTFLETAFEEMQEHEESQDLVELIGLMDQRFDHLITQIESRQLPTDQIETFVVNHIEQNEKKLADFLSEIKQLRIAEQAAIDHLYSTAQRLDSSVRQVDAKADNIDQKVDQARSELSRIERNAEWRKGDADAQRTQLFEQMEELKQVVIDLKTQMSVSERGSLDDSLTVNEAYERYFINDAFEQWRALPEAARVSFSQSNDLSVMLTTATMYEEAEEVLSTAAQSDRDLGLTHFNRYMNALKADLFDEALRHYQEAISLDASVALFPTTYEPREILGYGAFGVTFLCAYRGEQVALKSISLNRALGDGTRVTQRLKQEWAALKVLDDPRIVKAIDFNVNQQSSGDLRPFLTMEYFQGQSLLKYREQNLDDFGPRKLHSAISIAREVALGLSAAHEKSVIHRDIKPENILVRRARGCFEVKIIDFGLAIPPRDITAISQSLSLSPQGRGGALLAASIAGTLKYSPPEQQGHGGEVGPYSDVYSWAKTLYFLIFGTPTPSYKKLNKLPEPLRDLIEDSKDDSIEARTSDFGRCIFTLTQQLALLNQLPLAAGSGKPSTSDDDRRRPETSTRERAYPAKLEAKQREARRGERRERRKRRALMLNPVRGTAICIDFGASHIRAARFSEGLAKIIPLGAFANAMKTCLSWDDQGDIFFGSKAKRRLETHPLQTIDGNLLFSTLFSRVNASMPPHYPESLTVIHEGQRFFMIAGELYHPIEVAAKLLMEVKERAEDHLGHTLESVVISMHAAAYHSDRERLREACSLAGLEVISVTSQSTALALHHRYSEGAPELFALCRVGADSSSVQITEIRDREVQVISASACRSGGHQVDDLVLSHLREVFEAQAGLDLSASPRAMSRLREVAEQVKVELTNSSTTLIKLPSLMIDDGRHHSFEHRMTRRELEGLIKPVLDQVNGCVERALRQSGRNVYELDRVYVSGMSAQLPSLERSLRRTLGERIDKALISSELVSLGLAVRAGLFSGEINTFSLTDVAHHSLEVETPDSRVVHIINDNDVIPHYARQIITIDTSEQSDAVIYALQGESREVVGCFKVSSMSLRPSGRGEVELTLNIDQSSVIHVTAKDLYDPTAELKVTDLMRFNSGLLSALKDRLEAEA